MKRACGDSRVNNALYLCVDLSPYGKPIEYFLLDPTKPCDLKPFRTPIIVEGKEHNDIAIYIGKEFYPFIPDFVEESRIMGISRRIPKNFPFERLTPYKSRMFFVHERVIPMFDYHIERACPRKIKHSGKCGDACVFDLWHLSALETMKEKHEVSPLDENHVVVTTPSVKYSVNIPEKPQINIKQKKTYKYQIGFFATFWVGHLEYVNKEKKIPENLKKRVKGTEFDIKAVEE